MDGIFNIYKEKGFTSHDVVAIVRRTIHMKKVGGKNPRGCGSLYRQTGAGAADVFRSEGEWEKAV